MNLTELKSICEAATYFADEEGAIYSATGWRGISFRKLTPSVHNDGYLAVRITLNGVRKRVMIHKIMCVTYYGSQPSPAHEVRHLDGNKLNNAKYNLSWGTRKENAADRDKHGTTATGERNGFSKISDNDVVVIRNLACAGVTQRELAKDFGVSQRTIGAIVRREAWKHVG